VKTQKFGGDPSIWWKSDHRIQWNSKSLTRLGGNSGLAGAGGKIHIRYELLVEWIN